MCAHGTQWISHKMYNRHPLQLKKISILGAILELPAKQHCCLVGSSKTAPRILIFSIAMGADYTFYVKTIEFHARAFLTLNILAIGKVIRHWYLESCDLDLEHCFITNIYKTEK